MRTRLTLRAIAPWLLLLVAFFPAGPLDAQSPCLEWTPGLFHQGNGVDRSLNENGIGVDVFASLVFDDGTGSALYLGGSFLLAGGTPARGIVRWTGAGFSPLVSANGPLDAPRTVFALAAFDDGTGTALYAAGDFIESGGTTYSGVQRWDGMRWTRLAGEIGLGDPYALAVYDDGSGPALYLGGTFTSVDGAPRRAIARWDGFVWSSVGSGSNNGGIFGLTVFNDGTGPALYAAGNFTTAGGRSAANIARWNGSTWSALGGGLTGAAYPPAGPLAVFDDGSGPALYVGGTFTFAGGAPASHIARWNGTSWSPVGAGVDNQVSALMSFDDGSGSALYAGGAFTTAGGAPADHVARWNGSAWSALGSGTNDRVSAFGAFDDGSGPSLYAGGAFTVAGSVVALRLARWRGGSWSSLGQTGGGTSDDVRALEVFDAGSGPKLYAGGAFTSAGNVAADRIARWNGRAWSSLGASMTGFPGDPYTPAVSALEVFDDGTGAALYAGGSFVSIDGATMNSIAKWNGTAWSPLGSGVGSDDVYALAVFDDGTGPALYAGGYFLTAGGVPASSIARWNGASWSPLGTGMGGASLIPIVRALEVFDDGTGPALYAGGSFETAGGVPVNHIARWNGSAWSALGSGVSGAQKLHPAVHALETFDDGTGRILYAGGTFTHAGGTSARKMARWTGSLWTPVGTGPGGFWDFVQTLTTFDDGAGLTLYAGGFFFNMGGSGANNVAKWSGNGWSSLGSGVADVSGVAWVKTLAEFEDPAGPALYAGGFFSSAGEAASRHVARWGVSPSTRGNVNAAWGPVADVLLVNDSAGGSSRTVSASVGSPIEIHLDRALAGPLNGRYVVWAWPGSPQTAVALVRGSTRIGCLANPTPLHAGEIPQPIRCLRGAQVPRAACGAVPERPSPPFAPWTLRLNQGVGSPLTVTLQGLLGDCGAANALGFSVTNAVTLQVHP